MAETRLFLMSAIRGPEDHGHLIFPFVPLLDSFVDVTDYMSAF